VNLGFHFTAFVSACNRLIVSIRFVHTFLGMSACHHSRQKPKNTRRNATSGSCVNATSEILAITKERRTKHPELETLKHARHLTTKPHEGKGSWREGHTGCKQIEQPHAKANDVGCQTKGTGSVEIVVWRQVAHTVATARRCLEAPKADASNRDTHLASFIIFIEFQEITERAGGNGEDKASAHKDGGAAAKDAIGVRTAEKRKRR
jgi:hypothetical protein